MDSTELPADSLMRVAVDLVILTVVDGVLHVALVTRGIAPFRGRPALPGGFVRADEDLSQAAQRELAEETGIELGSGHLEQLASYGAVGRDPRGRVVSVAHLALIPAERLRGGGDARTADWCPVDAVLADAGRLAFDHARVLADGLERAASKIEYTSVAASLCPPEFTVGQLREVYQAVWRRPVDPRNFHRKVTSAENFLVPVAGGRSHGAGRPAQLYRVGSATLLRPPMDRQTIN